MNNKIYTDAEEALADFDREHKSSNNENINEPNMDENTNSWIGEKMVIEVEKSGEDGAAISVQLPTRKTVSILMLLSLIQTMEKAGIGTVENIMKEVKRLMDLEALESVNLQ